MKFCLNLFNSMTIQNDKIYIFVRTIFKSNVIK